MLSLNAGISTFHFQNALHVDRSSASCAIDTLCETFFYGMFKTDPSLQLMTQGFLGHLNQMCKSRHLKGFVTSEMREPIWNYCVDNLPDAFSPKGRFDAEVAAAYRHLGSFSKEKFCISMSHELYCQECLHNSVHQHQVNSLLTLSYTSHEKASTGCINDTVTEEVKNISRQAFSRVHCQLCDRRLTKANGSGTSIVLPKFLILELPVVDGKNMTFPPITIPEHVTIFDCFYELTAGVMLNPGHFWSVVKDGCSWLVLDDLSAVAQEYSCFSAAASQKADIDSSCHVTDIDEHSAVHIIILTKTCQTSLCEPISIDIYDEKMTSGVEKVAKGFVCTSSQKQVGLLVDEKKVDKNPLRVDARSLDMDTHEHNIMTLTLPSDGEQCKYITKKGFVYLLIKDVLRIMVYSRVKKVGFKPMEQFLAKYGRDANLSFIWNKNNTRRIYIALQSFYCLLENGFFSAKTKIRTQDFLTLSIEIKLKSTASDKPPKLSQRRQTKQALINLCENTFNGDKDQMMKTMSSLVTMGKSRRSFSKSGCLTISDIRTLMQGKMHSFPQTTVMENLIKQRPAKNANPILDAAELVHIKENFSGFRLGLELRKYLGSLVASRAQEDAYRENMHMKFKKILQPTKTFGGWSINAVNLIKLLRYRYPCIDQTSNLHVKIYGDGRQIGGRSTTFLALSILNNELYFTRHKYQSSDEIFPVAMFYESDTSENLFNNGKDVLQKMVSSLTDNGCIFYVSGDYNFLMALLDETFSAASNDRWNIYHSLHKDSRGDVHASGFRSDLILPMNNDFPKAIIEGISINSYVICIMHGFVRQVEKLLDLEIENIFSSGNKAEQLGYSKVAFIEESIAKLENNINRRGVRNGNFEIHFDNRGQPKPVKLNGTHAYVIMSPPPDYCSDETFPHPLHDVVCDTKKIRIQLCQNVLNQLQLDEQMTEFQLVKLIWDQLFQMQQIINNDPEPRLKQNSQKGSKNPQDYEWSYTPRDLTLYKLHAETFYQLFKSRYGWKKLTPYMMIYIDHVPQLMANLPFSLSRFMAQGGENANYRDNSFFYNHTTRCGGRKTDLQDPIYATFFHRFKNLCHDISHISSSCDPHTNASDNNEGFCAFLNNNEDTFDTIGNSHDACSSHRAEKGIFHGKYFILVGNIGQVKLKKAITDNGGLVRIDLPDKLSTKQITVITSQPTLDRNPPKSIRTAVRRSLPIVGVNFIENSIKSGIQEEMSKYSLSLKHVLKLVKCRDLTVKEKYFSGKCSMLSLLRKDKRKNLTSEKKAVSSKLKIYRNPATFYAMTRRKYFGSKCKGFHESKVLNKLLMAEWKTLTPRRKTKSTLEWTNYGKQCRKSKWSNRHERPTQSESGGTNRHTNRRLPF